MPKNLADLGHSGSSPEHLSGKGMAQQVSSFTLRLEACPEESPPNNVANGDGTGKSFMRSLHADKHAARGAKRPSLLQIRGQGATNIRRQRQAILARTFSPNQNCTGIPVNILQAQVYHFPRSQT
jgi:hypothetical protein